LLLWSVLTITKDHLFVAFQNKDAAEYCKKDNDFVEFGELHERGKRVSSGIADIVKDSLDHIPPQTLFEKHGGLNVLHNRRVDEVISVFHQFEKRQKVEQTSIDAQLRPWQEALESYLRGEIHPREVIWLWDTIGNTGKSWFSTYATVQHDTFVCSNGKSADIKYAYGGQRTVIFDLCRSSQDHINYEVIEDIKNGRYFSTKYV